MPRLDPEVFAYHRSHAEMLRRAAIRQAIASAGARLRHGVAGLMSIFVALDAKLLRATHRTHPL